MAAGVAVSFTEMGNREGNYYGDEQKERYVNFKPSSFEVLSDIQVEVSTRHQVYDYEVHRGHLGGS